MGLAVQSKVEGPLDLGVPRRLLEYLERDEMGWKDDEECACVETRALEQEAVLRVLSRGHLGCPAYDVDQLLDSVCLHLCG